MKTKKNLQFIDTALLNDLTYFEYMDRFKKIALSRFEWINLPDSMDARFLEMCLYYDGVASILKDNDYGIINTKCCSKGKINFYNLPTKLNCFSFGYNSTRFTYTGINDENFNQDNQAILVMNDWDMLQTEATLSNFALRLYEAERSCDVNIKNQKFPLLILTDNDQRLTMENLYNKIDGNHPAIFGDKNNLDIDRVKAIKTDVPFVADKLIEYKKEIWNEALTFLGINNIDISKKERLITGEANANNELINLNLESYLAPRKKACEQFNKLFGLTGDKAIDVKVRSDLHNIIKEAESIVSDYKEQELENDLEEGVINE